MMYAGDEDYPDEITSPVSDEYYAGPNDEEREPEVKPSRRPKAEFTGIPRASGECVCRICGKLYYDHPLDPKILSAIDNQPFVTVLCGGKLVKL